MRRVIHQSLMVLNSIDKIKWRIYAHEKNTRLRIQSEKKKSKEFPPIKPFFLWKTSESINSTPIKENSTFLDISNCEIKLP